MQLAATLEPRAREIESLSRDMLRYRRDLHHLTRPHSSKLHFCIFGREQRSQERGCSWG
jgi:hypothetical protein